MVEIDAFLEATVAAIAVTAITGRLPNLEDRVRRAGVGRLKTLRIEVLPDLGRVLLLRAFTKNARPSQSQAAVRTRRDDLQHQGDQQRLVATELRGS